MKIFRSMTELIGGTPLYQPVKYTEKKQIQASVFVKLEYLNPAGSAKDRAALSMIEDAEKSKGLAPGGTVIEPTSGNTGIGLAAIAASRGYRTIIVMPDTMSLERRRLMTAYGAELVLTEGSRGMKGAIEEAERLAAEIPGSIIAGQFVNSANPDAHFRTTGPEIWQDTDGLVDIFVSTVGTGGTLTGCASYLKSRNKNIKAYAVEPASSPLISEGKSGPHKIQGIGANFIPSVLDRGLIDGVITVTDSEAYDCGREFSRTEGILIGISSGAALSAALKLAALPENKGKNIVAVLPDGGERYLSVEGYLS